MKKNVKIIIACILVAAMAFGTYYYLNLPLQVDVVAIEKKDASLYFIEEGYVEGADRVDVFPMVGGKVEHIAVVEGQTVNKGDVLCTIDNSELALNISQLQTGIGGFQAQIKALEAQKNTVGTSKEEELKLQQLRVEKSQADLEEMEKTLQKMEVLLAGNIISQGEYDSAVTARDAGKNAVEASKQQLEVISAGQPQTSPAYFDSMQQYYGSMIAGQQANISILQDKVKDLKIVAPTSGTIKTLQVAESNTVSAQKPVATIATNAGNKIEVLVSSRDFRSLELGQSVELTFQSNTGDVTFPGKILAIDSEATSVLSSLGVSETKVKVTILPDTQEKISLFSGLPVDVKFTTFSEKESITVPKTAVFQDSKTGKDMVFVVEKGKAAPREVTLGLELRDAYVIKAGLLEEEVVVKDAGGENVAVGKKIAGLE